MNPPHNASTARFLFVGNGPYLNRGCEAIVRGTMEILRREFGADIRATAGVYAPQHVVRDQRAAETDAAVDTFCLDGMGPRWSRAWWEMQANKRLATDFAAQHRPLSGRLAGQQVALELGGDNYSLYHGDGKPERFMAMDRFLQRRGVPVVLWGASVGPFDADPVFAPVMFEHLRGLAGIFVRETESLEYLRNNGVAENVHLVADPAFVMKPVELPAAKIGFDFPAGPVGINLSPMVAFYRGTHASAVNLKEWLDQCVSLVKAAATLGRPILLVPHVGSEHPGNDDFSLLESVHQAVASEVNVPVHRLPRGLGAAELKWAIARCAVFAGARTHSTIAALSSCVPTFSIAYSLKARGINRDVYGNLDYCINVADLTPAIFGERLKDLLEKETPIRDRLRDIIPDFQAKAFSAGPLLRKLVAGPISITRPSKVTFP